jgi:hypothetical protein
MTEIRSWVTGVLAAVTVVIGIGAGVQITRADAVEPVTTVVAPQLPAPRTVAPPSTQPVAPPTTTTVAKKPPTSTSKPATRSASVDRSRCTNRIDYSDDPRDNATINSIGAETGKCPAPMRVYQEGNDRTLIEDQSKMRDVNGETYAEACRRMGYEPGPTCPAA